jgi:hypothetical protein
MVKFDIYQGPALHEINDFQVTVPLTWSVVIQSWTFESAQ